MLVDRRQIVSSEEIRDLAKEIGKSEWDSLSYLQRHGYILRILKGIFYVRSPNEIESEGYDHSIHELVAKALDFKGVKKWYFGLKSALKFNDMTHEYFNIEYVITDSYRTTKVIKILDYNFTFIKRGKNHFGFGINKKDSIYYSDPEKTVLDISYQRYLKDKESGYFFSPIKEYEDNLDTNKLSSYLEHYPKSFSEKVRGYL